MVRVESKLGVSGESKKFFFDRQCNQEAKWRQTDILPIDQPFDLGLH